MQHVVHCSSESLKSSRPLHSLALALALLASACGSDTVTVHGRISDDDGSQRALLGGSGTARAAATVQASTIARDGSLTPVAEAAVQADGRYEIEVPTEHDLVIIEARSSDDATLASTIAELSGNTDGEVTVMPMTTETSVEAQVLQAMVAHGIDPSNIDTVFLRRLIDAAMAVAVRGASAAGEAIEALLSALAEGVAGAQEARAAVFSKNGVSASQKELMAAELPAVRTLAASLDRGEDSDAAYNMFHRELAEVAERFGADAEAQSSAETAAGTTFAFTTSGRLDGQGDAAGAVVIAVLRAAAAAEARATAAALEAILDAAGTSSELMALVRQAANTLLDEIDAATSELELAEAFASFSASLIGEGSITSSILGLQLGLDGTTAGSAQAAVDLVSVAAGALTMTLTDAVRQALASTSVVDPGMIAAIVVDALTTFHDAVLAVVTGNPLVFGDQTDASTALLIEAMGHPCPCTSP